jgi:hypothetical protein
MKRLAITLAVSLVFIIGILVGMQMSVAQPVQAQVSGPWVVVGAATGSSATFIRYNSNTGESFVFFFPGGGGSWIRIQ